MRDLLFAFFFLLLGGAAGAIGLARWWLRAVSRPQAARKFLHQVYRYAHPYWLQQSADDKTVICPCCGWTDEPEEPGPEIAS